jgi:hypothetical protein
LKSTSFLFFSFIICFHSRSQNVLHTIDRYDKYDINIISNEINVFVDDSVYVFNNNPLTISKSDRFENLDLIHVRDSIYKNPGGGSIYKLNSNYQFKQILNKPSMEESFFQSSTFIRNDTIIQFGGYGNFSYKNDLIFVDYNLETWEYYPYDEKNMVKPPVGSPQYYSVSSDKLIIGGITSENQEGGQRNNIKLNEIWEFSFNTKTWALRGEYEFSDQFKGNIRSMFNTGNQYFTNTLFNTYFIIDFINDVWFEYKALPSLQNKIRGIKKIDNYYYILMQGSGSSIQLVQISSDRLLQEKIQQGHILIKNNSFSTTTVITFLSSLIFLIFVYFIVKKSRINNRVMLQKFKASNQFSLSVNEIRLINDLINNYPSGVSFKNISSYFDSNLNYETIKLKTRKLVYELNEKIKLQIKVDDLISVRRSNEDKRARVVYIKDNNRFN